MALKLNGMMLEYVPIKYKYNKDIVLVALNNNGRSLRFTPRFIKKDEKIVLVACRQDSSSLQYAHKSIREEIGKNNPVYYIQSKALFNKLEHSIPNKQEIKRKNKI